MINTLYLHLECNMLHLSSTVLIFIVIYGMGFNTKIIELLHDNNNIHNFFFRASTQFVKDTLLLTMNAYRTLRSHTQSDSRVLTEEIANSGEHITRSRHVLHVFTGFH